MSKLHPLLQALLDRKGLMSEREYEAERQRILEEEIGIAGAAPIKTIKSIVAPTVPIISPAELKRQEEERIRALVTRNKGKLTSYIVADGPKEKYIPRSAAVVEDGVVVHRILSDAEHKAIVDSERKAAQASAPKPAIDPTVAGASGSASIPHGFEVKGGIIRPIAAAPKAPDPKVEEIRRRWKAGEFGQGPSALATAQKLIKEAQAERPVGGRIDCSVCHGKMANDKIIGKLCRCGGKGFLAVDVDAACKIAAMGCGAIDPLPESPDSISYTAFLTDGRRATMHADNGKKAIQSACASLRASATGFERIALDSGCMLVLRSYMSNCPGCHGTMLNGDRTCTQCENGRIVRHGGRFFFSDKLVKEGESERMVKAAELAEDCGHDSMMGFDPDRTCGKEKCKGHHGAINNLLAKFHAGEIDEVDLIPQILSVRIGKDGCYACRDAMLGGYQFAGFIRCSGPCKGSGKVNGEKCEKCSGKGYFRTTEFAWLCDGSSFAVTNEIRRIDLLTEDRIPKRDRNITIKVGEDTVEVGAGKKPSRNSGSVCSVTGTKRNKYDSAQTLYGSQTINTRVVGGKVTRSWSHRATQGAGFRQRARNYVATFSDG